MKIAILLHPYGEEKPAGLGRAILEITRNILKIDHENEYLILLKEEPRTPPPLPGNNWQLRVVGYKYLWLTRKFDFLSADLYVFPTPITPLFFRPKMLAVIVYDFAYKYFTAGPKQKLHHFWIDCLTRSTLKKVSRVVTISEFTLAESRRFFNVPKSKITAIPLGYSKICSHAAETVANTPKPYFLFVGVIKERKNILNLVRAFEEFKRNDPARTSLVIAGKGEGEYFQKVRRCVQESELGASVIFTGHVSDEQLSYLYANAEAFVFPSLLEGFGLPILEAMDCGVPVITSSRGALREIAQGAALLVNPEDQSELAGAMRRIVNDKKLHSELVSKGYQRSKEYSWEKTAQRYVELFKALESQ